MKTGLILEGGAMRCMFTSAILDVMLENDINFDGMVSVSAGTAFGSNFKSKQPGRALRYSINFCNDPRFCSVRSLIKTGDMFGAEFCYNTIPNKLDIFDYKTFEETPIEFYLVCTDIVTGEPYYKKCDKADDNLMQWFRATSSLPLVAKTVEIDGVKYLDGGMVDSIPLRFLENLGYDRNVVILTQPKGFVKKQTKSLPWVKLVYRKYPNLVKAVATRHTRYNETIKYIEEKEKAGELLVLRPDAALPIDRVEHDPKVLHQVYEVGRKVALERLDEIKAYLNI